MRLLVVSIVSQFYSSWSGSAEKEVGTDQNGVVRVRINEKYYRPTEVEQLLGDATKARQKLGWTPQITFEVIFVLVKLYSKIIFSYSNSSRRWCAPMLS